jgi:hypothetical protein
MQASVKKIFTVAALTAIAVAACAPQPPHWEKVCAASHTRQSFMPNVRRPLAPPTIRHILVCDKYEWHCIVDPNYRGRLRSCTRARGSYGTLSS